MLTWSSCISRNVLVTLANSLRNAQICFPYSCCLIVSWQSSQVTDRNSQFCWWLTRSCLFTVASHDPSCEHWTGAKPHSPWCLNHKDACNSLAQPRLAFAHLSNWNCWLKFAMNLLSHSLLRHTRHVWARSPHLALYYLKFQENMLLIPRIYGVIFPWRRLSHVSGAD